MPKSSKKVKTEDKNPPISDPEKLMPESSKEVKTKDKNPPIFDPEKPMPESSKEVKTEDKNPPIFDPEKPMPESSKEAKTENKDLSMSDPEKPKPESSKEAETVHKDPPTSDPEKPRPESSDTDAPNDGNLTKRAISEPTLLTDQKQAEAEPMVRPTKSAPDGRETEPDNDSLKAEAKSQDGETPKEKSKNTSSFRRIVTYTMTGFFDWNPSYLIQMRGIFNILHVLMGIIVIVLLGVNCQLHTFPNGPSEGFFCQPPETFLFVSSIAAFLTATIYLLCCLLSKKTEALLFETSFEISYYVLYFVLLLTSSSALLISAINWGSERMMYGNDYDLTHAAAIIGLINSILYGLSAVIFFVSQRYHFYSSSQSSTKV